MFVKYFERGLSVIPVEINGKNPTINNWSKFCYELPSESQVEAWQRLYDEKLCNIGLACGKASNLIALDIDTDSKDYLDVCPMSPIVKRGAKGETRFFKYNKNIASKSYPLIDILSDGRQTVVPPSIHITSKKPYKWLTIDTLENFDQNDLPELRLEFLEKLKIDTTISEDTNHVTLSGVFNNIDPSRESPTGSQARLKKLAAGFVAAKKPFDEAVNELLQYDIEHHKPVGYFFERGRVSDQKYGDPYLNAFHFYTSIFNSINLNRIRQGLEIEKPDVQKLPVIEIVGDDNNEKEISHDIKYPEPRGIMRDFWLYCEKMSNGKQDALALAGGLSLMSILAANRFKTENNGRDVWPNLYVMSLAPSGFGKEIAQSTIQRLLENTELLGAANYRSGTAIIKDLAKQQTRLDIIDECSSILNAMGSKEVYRSEIVEVLSSLYSKAPTKFLGFTSAMNGTKVGACWNPCVSLLGCTTPVGFRESVKKEMAGKGLLPRFLVFYQKTLGDFRGREKKNKVELDALFNKIKKSINSFLEIEQRTLGKKPIVSDCGIQYDPCVIPFTDKANDLLLNFEEKYHYIKIKDPDGFTSAFQGRFAELASKISLLDALSLGKERIDSDSVLWAIDVIEAQWHGVKDLYEIAASDNEFEKLVKFFFQKIKKRGLIKKRDLQKARSGIKVRELNEILEKLVEQDLIEKVIQKNANNVKIECYRCASKDTL